MRSGWRRMRPRLVLTRSQSRSEERMSKSRVRSSGRRSRSRASELKVHRFIGISLGGGKTDKTCLAILEYYPAQNKIFLSRLFDRIKTEGEVSADLQVHSLIAHCPSPL